MSDRPGRDDDRFDDVDTGAPVAELADLARPASSGLLGGIRRAIYRRALIGEVADLTWSATASVFVEYLTMLFAFLKPRNPEGR